MAVPLVTHTKERLCVITLGTGSEQMLLCGSRNVESKYIGLVSVTGTFFVRDYEI